jgi:hypothetical protein
MTRILASHPTLRWQLLDVPLAAQMRGNSRVRCHHESVRAANPRIIGNALSSLRDHETGTWQFWASALLHKRPSTLKL